MGRLKHVLEAPNALDLWRGPSPSPIPKSRPKRPVTIATRTLTAPSRDGHGDPPSQRRKVPVLAAPRSERTPSPRPRGRTALPVAPKVLARWLVPGRTSLPRQAIPSLEEKHLESHRNDNEESDATTSESEVEAQRQRRAVTQLQVLRSRQRHRRVLFETTETGQTTFLERSAVRNNERYNKVLQKFLSWPPLHAARLVEDSEVDDATVKWANAMYLSGKQANLEETLLAAICQAASEFGLFGSRQLPRFHRALRGWRRRTPARSRAPHVFSMWCSWLGNFVCADTS